mgnify:CR=1 FL=1
MQVHPPISLPFKSMIFYGSKLQFFSKVVKCHENRCDPKIIDQKEAELSSSDHPVL